MTDLFAGGTADLAALVGSRLCHDLISPIGAIGNGLELLSLMPGSASPELALAEESVAAATARVRFFRLAFGTAGTETVARAEIAAILAAWTRGSRFEIAWGETGDPARAEARLAFLLLLCLEQAMPLGGRIGVARSAAGWQIEAKAPRLRLDPPLWHGLAGLAPLPAIGPAEVQFVLAAEALARRGRALALTESAGRLTLGY